MSSSYCDARSRDGHHCAMPVGHSTDELHYGGSPIIPKVEWVFWKNDGTVIAGQEVTRGESDG